MRTASGILNIGKEAGRTSVAEEVRAHRRAFSAIEGGSAEARRREYRTVVSRYYDLVTEFYERGWGDSFHFAPRFREESLVSSLIRHEHYLALRLGVQPGMRLLDVGCGIGGPMREIARFTGASIVGVNNNALQLERLRRYNREAGLASRCEGVEADFMEMPFEEESFDRAYAIEATCHAPDKVGVFHQVGRSLKPGGLFGGYEWCLTDLYDAGSGRHRQIREAIEEGNGLPELGFAADVERDLASAGLEVIEVRDLSVEGDPETPWYRSLAGEGLEAAAVGRSPMGRALSRHLLVALERLRLVPEGSAAVSALLNRAADGLVDGGRLGIFTPMLFFLARKPALPES